VHLFTVRGRYEQLSRGSRIYSRVDSGKPLGTATLRCSDLRDAAEPSCGSSAEPRGINFSARSSL
jgi:hypothetical protein